MPISEMIRWGQLMAVLERVAVIPPDAMALIRAKPESTDRKADSAWRRACAEWNIDTSARKVSVDDRVSYDRVRRLEAKVADLEGLLSVAQAALRKAEAANTFYRIHPRGLSDSTPTS